MSPEATVEPKKRKTTAERRRSLIGEALVKEGLLKEDQLKRALRIQQLLEQPRQLGEILIELGYATRQSIAEVVAKYGRSMRLGEILLEQGIISENDLDTALEMQKERGGKIGEFLIELGAINERTLLQNLAYQARVPYIEPSFAMIEPGVLNKVSPDYLERFLFVPFSRGEDQRVTVVVNDLNHEAATQAIESVFKGGYSLALGPLDAIKQTVKEFRQFRMGRTTETERREVTEDSVVKLVDHVLNEAISERASDIHIEPMSDKIRLRYRIDGELVFKTELPKELLPKIVSRIKIMAECNIAEHQKHQGGRILYDLQKKPVDLRVSFYVSVHGECTVIRVLNKEMGLVSLDELGMTPTMLERFRTDALDIPTGVVLITGPTGSGKTTTLYSSLDYCNNIGTKIITVEDPVEYLIDGIVQCSVADKAGRSFEASLREIVRQDPNIIVLGEIRDRVTAETAIQAALTGHKVYSTFHTEDTIGGLLRLMDMDIETFLISSTVISVVAQRLLRRICKHCAMPYTPAAKEVLQVGLNVDAVREYELKKGKGCKHCNYTGYFGRVGVYELLILNDAIKESILQKRPAHDIRTVGMETTGLISMREDGIAKTIRGLTTFGEVLKYTPTTFALRPLRQILTMTQ